MKHKYRTFASTHHLVNILRRHVLLVSWRALRWAPLARSVDWCRRWWTRSLAHCVRHLSALCDSFPASDGLTSHLCFRARNLDCSLYGFLARNDLLDPLSFSRWDFLANNSSSSDLDLLWYADNFGDRDLCCVVLFFVARLHLRGVGVLVAAW